MKSVLIFCTHFLVAILGAGHLAMAEDAVPATPAATAYSDLRFSEFFKLPIGPRGFEISPKLQSLNGKPVRIAGYMARQDGETAVPGLFILSPIPVTLGDEDESFADDLPASILYVHLKPGDRAYFVKHMSGLIGVHGTLEIGSSPEIDGRVSFVRLRINGEPVLVNGDPIKPATASLN